jgi:hypothetical protein
MSSHGLGAPSLWTHPDHTSSRFGGGGGGGVGGVSAIWALKSIATRSSVIFVS